MMLHRAELENGNKKKSQVSNEKTYRDFSDDVKTKAAVLVFRL